MFRIKVLNFLIWLSPGFDALRGQYLFYLIWHRLTRARRLTAEEISLASAVIGASTLHYPKVRIASGGILNKIFTSNGSRAFTTFHTINLPQDAPQDILIHELAHVRQYERAGSKIMLQALRAQFLLGAVAAYQYGGPDGLSADFHSQKTLPEFNREQQAQIIQDYFVKIQEQKEHLTEDQTLAYNHFLDEFRTGKV